MEASAALVALSGPVTLIRLTGGEHVNAADIAYIRPGDFGEGSHIELHGCNRDFVDDRDPDELVADIADLQMSTPSRCVAPTPDELHRQFDAEARRRETRLV